MDPTNCFETHNIDRMDQILNQVFDTPTDKRRIVHAKDVKRSGNDKSEKHADIGDEDALESHTFRSVGEIGLPAPAPGLGSLNYDLYLKRLAGRHPNTPVIIEHLSEDDVPGRRNSSTASSRRTGTEGGRLATPGGLHQTLSNNNENQWRIQCLKQV
jgi:sugar phosphate isomerase/epimerase